MKYEKSKSLAIIFFCVFFIELAQEFYYAHEFFVSRKALGWPSVSGTILEVKTVRTPGKISRECAEVRYSYTLKNNNLEGNRISFGDPECGDTESVIKKFPKGSLVKVFINPNNINDAVLVVGDLSESTWVSIKTIGVFLFVFAIFTIYYYIKYIRSIACRHRNNM